MENKDTEYKKLYSLCKKFREIVDKCVEEYHDLFFDFPHGYCAQVSIWAYDYLTSNGYENIVFRNRDPFFYNRCGNHVWLHWKEYSIDLSCDQFSKKYASVIIIKDNEDNTPERRYSTNFEVTNIENRVQMEYVPVYSVNKKKKLEVIYAALGIELKY